jgi:5'-nucleotidase
MATPVVLTQACEFDSCPGGSPAVGNNESDHRLNYVNSYPATAMMYGVETLAPEFFGAAPDFALSGPNKGSKFTPQVLHRNKPIFIFTI